MLVQLLRYADTLVTMLRPAVQTLEAPSLSPRGGFHFPLLPPPLPAGAFHPLPPPDVVLEYFAEDGGVGVRAMLVSLHAPASMLPETPPALWPAQSMLARHVSGPDDGFQARATVIQNCDGTTGDRLDVACCVPQATQPAFLQGFGGGSFVHGHEYAASASALAATGGVSVGASALSCALSDAFGSSSPVTRALLHPLKSWSPPADEPTTPPGPHKTGLRWRLGRRRPGAGTANKTEPRHVDLTHDASHEHGEGAGRRGAMLSQSLVGHVVNFNGHWLKVHQAHVGWTSVPQLSVSLQAMRAALVDLAKLRNAAAAAVHAAEPSAAKVTCRRHEDAAKEQANSAAAVRSGSKAIEHGAARDAAIAARHTAQRKALEAARERRRECAARDEREERAWADARAGAPARSEAQPQPAVPAPGAAVRAATQPSSSIFDDFDAAPPAQLKPKPTNTAPKPPPSIPPKSSSDPFQSSIFDDF